MKLSPFAKGAIIAGGGLLLFGLASGAAKAGPGADGPNTEPPSPPANTGLAIAVGPIKVARTADTEAYGGAKIRRRLEDGAGNTYRAAIGAVLGSATGRVLAADGVQFVEFVNKANGRNEYVAYWFVEPATATDVAAQQGETPEEAGKGFWESTWDTITGWF